MSRCVDETRREFLVRLAASSAFAVPVIRTVVLPAALEAQGKGGGGGGGGKGDPCRRRRPPPWCLSRTAQLTSEDELVFNPQLPVAPGANEPLLVAPWDRVPP